MKTYKWKVSNGGEVANSGIIIIDSEIEVVNVIQEIEKQNKISISNYDEFTIKQVIGE